MKRRRNWLAALLFVVLLGVNLLSFSTTALGGFTYLQGALDLPKWALLTGAFAASALIQALIVGFWTQVWDGRVAWRARVVFLAAALVMSVVSLTPGTGFWSDLVDADAEIALIETQRTADAALAPLDAYGRRMAEIARSSTALSALMQRQMSAERDRGNSCDGPAVETGEGPRYRLAERLVGESQERSAIAESLAAEARDIITIPAGARDADLAAAMAAARELAYDPRLAQLRVWADDLATGFETSFVDPKTQANFTCRSVAVAADLRRMIALIDEPVELSYVTPSATEAGLDTALRASFAQTASVIGWLAFGGSRPDSEILDATRPAIALAATVEGIIVLLTLLHRLALGGASPALPCGNPVHPDDRAALQRTVTVMRTLHLPMGRNDYFVVPQDGNMVLRAEAEVARDRWRMREAPARLPVDLSMIAPDIHAILTAPTGGARTYRVYRLPKRALIWLRQASIDLHDSVRTINFDPDPSG